MFSALKLIIKYYRFIKKTQDPILFHAHSDNIILNHNKIFEGGEHGELKSETLDWLFYAPSQLIIHERKKLNTVNKNTQQTFGMTFLIG